MRSAVLLVAAILWAASPAAAQPRQSESSPAAFWETLGDTTLERLIGQALRSNLDLQAVAARVDGARADRFQTALDLAPVITASSAYSRQRLASATLPGASGTLPDQNVWDAGVRMSWELDVFGRTRNSVKGRGALIDAAEEDVRDVEVLLAAEIARVYFDLRGAQDRLAVARRNAENQRGTLQITLDRLEAGRGSGLDSERAQAQLSSTLAEIPALEAAIAAGQHRIAVLLGRPPASIAAELGDAQPDVELPALGGVADAEAVVRQRPDVRRAEHQLAARSAFVNAAKADYLPRLSISGVAGYTSNAFDRLGNSGTPRYAIGPVLSWPLLDLGRVKAGVEAARAGEIEADARYDQAVLRALEEVETSVIAYEKAVERLEHLEAAAAASERATELARLRFEEGVTDYLEVLDAERTQLEAQDRRAAGRTHATNGLIALYRALGGRSPATGS
jgi:outer membrane protein, multidrug efflux system